MKVFLTNYSKHTPSIAITRINQCATNINHCSIINISSKFHKGKNISLSFLILPKITDNVPQITFDTISDNINVADESFNKLAPINVLLGSSICWQLFETGKLNLNYKNLLLQNTKLGWIVSGQLLHNNQLVNQVACLSLKENVEKFWQVEEFITNKKHLTPDESICEDKLINTTFRDNSGRFVVNLPLNENYILLGNSKSLAIKKCLSLEKRLGKNSQLK